MARGYFFSFKTQHKENWTFLWVLLVLVLITVVLFSIFKVSDSRAEKRMESVIARATASLESDAEKINASCKLKDPLNSSSYVLLWLSTYNRKFEDMDEWVDLTEDEVAAKAWKHDRVILAEKADKKIYPASMAKIITALVIIENEKDLNKKITLTWDDFNHFFQDGASIAGFAAGDSLSVNDLLHGLLISSGSECTTALSKDVAGSEAEFVKLMNKKAKDIGMKHTHFTNPIGLHDKKTYSTVCDLALALNYALRNLDFYDLFTTVEYKTSPTESAPKGYKLASTLMQKEDLGLDFPDGYILGGKTGYTYEAGQCLASSFIKNGEQFILITANARPDNFRVQTLQMDDLLTVYDSVQVTK